MIAEFIHLLVRKSVFFFFTFCHFSAEPHDHRVSHQSQPFSNHPVHDRTCMTFCRSILLFLLLCLVFCPQQLQAQDSPPVQTGSTDPATLPASQPTSAPSTATTPATAGTGTSTGAETTSKLVDDADYQQHLIDWRHQTAFRHLDDRDFLFYPSQKGHLIGQIVFFADWQQSASLLPMAQMLSQQGYHCYILLPFPQQQQLPPIQIVQTPPPSSPDANPAVTQAVTANTAATETQPTAPQADSSTPPSTPASKNPDDLLADSPVRQALIEEWQHQLQIIQSQQNAAPLHTLWIGQGLQTVWLHALINGGTPPDAVILLNAGTVNPALNQQLANEVVQWPMPVLDLIDAESAPIWLQAAQMRAVRVQQQNKLTWRQRFASPDNQPTEINGWLRSMGWR